MDIPLKNLAIIGQPPELLLGFPPFPQWKFDQLIAVLNESPRRDSPEIIALFDIDDKSYWVDRIIGAGFDLLSTHPIAVNSDNAKNIERQSSLGKIYILHEYVRYDSNRLNKLKAELDRIGPILFFTAEIHVVDALVIPQVLLELFDFIQFCFPSPIDEIYSRRRNLTGDLSAPNLITAQLRMKDGSEGQVIAHGLSVEEPSITIRFYGRNGQHIWSGLGSCREVPIVAFEKTIKSYQTLDWFVKSGRFDRVVNYKEALK